MNRRQSRTKRSRITSSRPPDGLESQGPPGGTPGWRRAQPAETGKQGTEQRPFPAEPGPIGGRQQKGARYWPPSRWETTAKGARHNPGRRATRLLRKPGCEAKGRQAAKPPAKALKAAIPVYIKSRRREGQGPLKPAPTGRCNHASTNVGMTEKANPNRPITNINMKGFNPGHRELPNALIGVPDLPRFNPRAQGTTAHSYQTWEDYRVQPPGTGNYRPIRRGRANGSRSTPGHRELPRTTLRYSTLRSRSTPGHRELP